MYALKTMELTKKFGNIIAVDKVSLCVKNGAILGIVGENGAGKSTLLKMITSSIYPTSGSVEFGDVKQQGMKPGIGGYVNVPKFYDTLSAKENVEVIKRVSGKKECLDTKEVLDIVGLSDTGGKAVSKFSLGMKQRLALAMSLVTQPGIIILDEPLNGLDPQGIQDFRELIISLSETKGITFIISSHLLLELEKIASDYIFMKKGKVIMDISEKELKSNLCNYIKFNTNDIAKVKGILEDLVDTDKIIVDGDVITIISPTDKATDIIKKIDSYGKNFLIEKQDLETYYKELMKNA